MMNVRAWRTLQKPRVTLRELGERVGVTPQAIKGWEVKGVPAKWVLPLERATGVPRHEWRPDIYPLED